MRGAENAGPEDGDSAIAAGEPLHSAEMETNAPTNSAQALRTNLNRVMDVFRTGCYAKPTFIHAVEACTRSMGYLLFGVLRGQREVESDWLRDFHADRWVLDRGLDIAPKPKATSLPDALVRQL